MSHIRENAGSRERLQTLTSQLTDEELALQTGDGWTISAILAHLAFWDYRVLMLIETWKEEGVGRSPIDIDNVNDAMKPLCLAIPARKAVNLALHAANAVDLELENLSEELRSGIGTLMQQGRFRLTRALHRNEHLDRIERILVEFRKTGRV